MELRNCIVCGKVFVYTSRNICPACREIEEKEYHLVRDYLYKHRGAALIEVHEATGVAVERITKFLREGRLVEAGVEWKALECEICGEPISSGRLCPRCAGQLSQQLQAASKDLRREDPLTSEKGKVYTIDRLTKKDR